MTPDEAIAIVRQPISVDYFDWNAAGRVLADEVERLKAAIERNLPDQGGETFSGDCGKEMQGSKKD